MSVKTHLLHVTGTTIIATLVTTYVTNQIRVLWVYECLRKSQVMESLAYRLERRVCLLLGLGEFKDNVRNPQIPFVYLVAGLITTSIVAGLTPTTVIMHIPLHTTLDLNHNRGIYGPCMVFESSTNNSNIDEPSWNLSNGSSLRINASADPWCAIPRVLSTISDSTVNAPSEDGFPYIMGTSPVHRSALGVPFTAWLTTAPGFSSSFGSWPFTDLGSDFLWASQCFPAVIRNPVQCQKAGSITTSENEMTVSTTACNITNRILTVDPRTAAASTAGICTAGYAVGKAAIVMGSVNGHARLLANAMNDADFDEGSQQSYSVLCSVDIAPSVSFRTLNLTRAVGQFSLEDRYGLNYVVRGSVDMQSCTSAASLSDVLPDLALATGAAASMQLLSEGADRDGWWPTLYYASNPSVQFASGRGAFDNSRSALEDVFGLASAIALGLYWGGGGEALAQRHQEGVIAVHAVQVGPGAWWALVYILPSAATAVVLLALLYRLKK